MSTTNLTITQDFISPIPAYHIKQLLVGIEISQADEAILTYLNFLTKNIPTAAAYFLHVFKDDDIVRTYYEVQTEMVVGPYKIDEAMRKDMQNRIISFLEAHKSIHMQYDTKDGVAMKTLLKTASSVDPDLMVIGQDTEAIHNKILAGHLIRKNSCDTLIIPDKAKAVLNNILVPIDFSISSIKALRRAISINRCLEKPIAITCLNIYDTPNLSIYQSNETTTKIQAAIEEDRKIAFDVFLENYVIDDADRRHITIEIVEKGKGDIGINIVNFAKNNNIDLTVMGAKGHSRIHLLVMGSVTERVLLLNKSQPVLVVK